MSDLPNMDIDSAETQEWLESLESVLENEGSERAHYLLESLIERARRAEQNGEYLRVECASEKKFSKRDINADD